MWVNQQFRMNFGLAITSFLLGILTAFVVWSFLWTMESRKEVTFDMPGDVTVITMTQGQRLIASADAAVAQKELVAYLRDHSVALIVSSSGDGRPEVIVADPHGLVPWFPYGNSEKPGPGGDNVYLFKGTYSERRWSENRALPLLPKGMVVAGVIAAPRHSGDLQYARRIGKDLLPPGQYTLSTSDPSHLRQICNILSRMGLVPEGIQRIPLLVYMIQNPLLVITALFLAVGYVCDTVSWLLYFHWRAREFFIRSRHGALPSQIVRENLLAGLPGLVAGSVAGVVSASLLVMAIGQIRLDPGDFLALTYAMGAAIAMATLKWFMTLCVSVYKYYDLHFAA